MKKIILLILFCGAFSLLGKAQTKPDLGTVANFTILAATGIYNKDATRVSGNVGVWPGTAIQGFTTSMINGTRYPGNATAQRAQTDLKNAYQSIEALATTPGKNVTGTSLNGQILSPGVYTFDNTTTLSGTINLDAANDPNAIFIFQVKGGLITAANTTIRLLNNARRMNIFWQVADTINIGTRSSMVGNFLAKKSIRLGKDAAVNGGRLLSTDSKVVLNKNNPVTTSTDLEITQTKSLGKNGVNPYSVGELVTFTIVARNFGPINDYNVKIVDQLDVALEYIGASATIGNRPVNTFTYNNASRVFQWTAAEFKNGEIVTLKIEVRIKSPGGIVNTATILGTVTDDNFDNNSASIVPAICATITNPGTITGPTSVCIGSKTNVFSVAAIPGVESYTWIVPTGWKVLPLPDGEAPTNSITVELPATSTGESVAAEGTVAVTVDNGCGNSEPSFLEVKASTLLMEAPDPITANDPAGYNPCLRNTETFFTYQINEVAHAEAYEWWIGIPSDSTNAGGWQIISGQTSPRITVKVGAQEVIISVRAKNGCGSSPVTTLRVSPTLADPTKPTSVTGPAAICAGTPSASFTVAGVPGDRFTWKVPDGWSLTGQGTSQIQVIAPVTAANTVDTIEVAAVNNCGTSTALKIAVNVVERAKAEAITGLAASCTNNTVTYTVRAPGATSFTWKVLGELELIGTVTNDSVTVLIKPGGGILSVIPGNACGPGQEQSLAIVPQLKVNPPLRINTASVAPCAGNTGLTFSVAAVAGATGYSWQIVDSDAQPAAGWQITAVSPDQRTITVTAGSDPATIAVTATNGCGNSTAQTLAVQPVKIPPSTPGPITGNTNVCAGNANLKYSVAAVAGAVSYLWTVPTGEGWAIISGQGTPQVLVKAGATEGFIAVKTENICGESSLASQKKVIPGVGKPPAPGSITGSKTVTCAKEANLTYSVAPIPGVSVYDWKVPDGWVITDGATTNRITVTAGPTSGSGFIYVVAYNNCGPGTSSAPLAVSVSSPLAAPAAINGEPILCLSPSTNAKYTAAAVPGATSYLWTLPDGWAITAGDGTAEITVAVTGTGGILSVKAKNDCFESKEITLAVTTSTAAPAILGEISGSTSVCRNQTELIYSVTPVPTVSDYFWTVPEGWKIVSGNGTARIKVNANATPGVVSVLSKNGCGDAAAPSNLTVAVTNEAAVTPGAISGSQQVCAEAADLTYSIAAVNGASGYFWEVPVAGGWRILAGQGTTTIKVQAGTSNDTLTVKAINGCGPGPASALVVNVLRFSSEPLQIVGTKEQCAGSTAQLYQIAAIPGALSYAWKVPESWVIEDGQGTTAIRVTAGKEAGNVEVIATTACGSNKSGSLAVASATESASVPGDIGGDSKSLICSGQRNVTYTIEPVPGAVAYRWQIEPEPTDTWAITAGQGTTSIQVTAGTRAAIISVQVINGCGISDASTLEVHPGASPVVVIDSIAGPGVTCANQTELTYSVAAVGGATGYTWNLPEGWKINAGENTHTITVTAGTTGGVISVVAFNDCMYSAPDTLAVTLQPALPAPPPIKDESSACAGLIYAIDAPAGINDYQWAVPEGWSITEGQGTPRIKVSAPEGSVTGNIRVTAQTSTCTSAVTTLSVNPDLGRSNLQVANVFSPNGDGINEAWTITNISNYPDNEVLIINRWGSEVYQTKAYQNNWNGDNLTDGTYYYVLKVKTCDGTYQTQKGYVMIMR